MMVGRERELLAALFEIVLELDWVIAVPADQDSDNPDDIRGLIIGDVEYLEYLLGNLPEGGTIANEEIH